MHKSAGLQRAPFRYTPCPVNAVEKHGELHQKLADFAGASCEALRRESEGMEYDFNEGVVGQTASLGLPTVRGPPFQGSSSDS